MSELNPLSKLQPTQAMNEWLSCETPITDKLMNMTGEAKLVVLTQKTIKLSMYDRVLLQLQDEVGLVREILMKSHNKAYWYARTVIPQDCYQMDSLFFNRLNNETLRELIYNEPKVERVTRSIYPITSSADELLWLKPYETISSGTYWVRVSGFLFNKRHHFYLIEILFPSLELLP